jgi:hypothetical protein
VYAAASSGDLRRLRLALVAEPSAVNSTHPEVSATKGALFVGLELFLSWDDCWTWFGSLPTPPTGGTDSHAAAHPCHSRSLTTCALDLGPTQSGDTALHAACRASALDVVSMLLEAGASPHAVSSQARRTRHSGGSLGVYSLEASDDVKRTRVANHRMGTLPRTGQPLRARRSACRSSSEQRDYHLRWRRSHRHRRLVRSAASKKRNKLPSMPTVVATGRSIRHCCCTSLQSRGTRRRSMR